MNAARFLKHVWPFYNIMYERAKLKLLSKFVETHFTNFTNPYSANFMVFHLVYLVEKLNVYAFVNMFDAKGRYFIFQT